MLLPQAQVDVEAPAGVVPFLQDLTASLNSNGIDCSMPPIVYEQVGVADSADIPHTYTYTAGILFNKY